MTGITSTVLEKARPIELLICDVDGVLTDGRISYDDRGVEYKSFYVHDGLGIKLLLENTIEVAVISSRSSTIVEKRMAELNIRHVYQGHGNKIAAFEELKNKLQLTDQQIAYIGDDLPDLTLIRRVGLGIAVANAVATLHKHADYITQKNGGAGAVREVCELLLEAKNCWPTIEEHYLL